MTDRTIYTVRRQNISRKESAMIRKLLDDHCAALKNHIVSMVEAGDDEYGKSGMTGITYARETAAQLREYQALFLTFPPDERWEE